MSKSSVNNSYNRPDITRAVADKLNIPLSSVLLLDEIGVIKTTGDSIPENSVSHSLAFHRSSTQFIQN